MIMMMIMKIIMAFVCILKKNWIEMFPLKHRLESLFEETEYEHLSSYAFLINKHWNYFILFYFIFVQVERDVQ